MSLPLWLARTSLKPFASPPVVKEAGTPSTLGSAGPGAVTGGVLGPPTGAMVKRPNSLAGVEIRCSGGSVGSDTTARNPAVAVPPTAPAVTARRSR